MKPHVHLQGSGQEATVITSSISSGFPPPDGTITLSHNTSLWDLTVVSDGTGVCNTAVLAKAGASEVLIADITAKSHGNGTSNYAIFINGSGTSVTLQSVNALSENGSGNNYGLYGYQNAVITLRGGAYRARGGSSAYGIYNLAALDAEGVTARAENGTYNSGFENSGAAIMRSGLFTGLGGTEARAIRNSNSGSSLAAESITALAENGLYNYGLYNRNGADAMLFGGTFTGRGGTIAYGIRNSNNNAIIEANNIHVLAESGGNNYGFYNYSGIANVTQSVLKASPYSAFNSSGTLIVSNSRLVGGPCSGSVTCVLVTRGTMISFDGSTCP
jgi:hypothetical protein